MKEVPMPEEIAKALLLGLSSIIYTFSDANTQKWKKLGFPLFPNADLRNSFRTAFVDYSV